MAQQRQRRCDAIMHSYQASSSGGGASSSRLLLRIACVSGNAVAARTSGRAFRADGRAAVLFNAVFYACFIVGGGCRRRGASKARAASPLLALRALAHASLRAPLRGAQDISWRK